MINKNVPYFEKSHNEIIPSNAQFFNLTVGSRGSGKSASQERLLEELFLKKWTVFDAWSAGFESLFYCINMDCKKKRKERIEQIQHEIRIALARNETESIQSLEDESYKLKNELGCECHRRFPITILISEAIKIDQKSIDTINGRYYTKSEYVSMMRAKGEIVVEYDDNNPPEKPISQRGKEWIKVVKLPFPTKTDGTEINQEIINRFTDAVLSCRKEKRILCYVPSLFPTDFARYRTLAVIITNLPKITDKHFQPLYEHEVGKPKDQWNLEQKNHHRFCLLLRELAELSPANMKTNEFANLTKRSILSIIYTSRHSRISILCDVQKVESVFKEVRSMCNTILIKRSTSSLLGEELKDVQKRIEANQERMFAKFGRSDEAKQFVYSKYPPLEKLNKNYAYVLYDDDWIEKWQIPNTMHHKKQEDDSFFKLTGFSYTVDEEMIKSVNQKKSAKVDAINDDEKELFEYIDKLRNPSKGKSENWKTIKEMLIDQQKNGKFKKQDSFKNKDHNSIGKWFKRNITKFVKSE